MITLVLTLGAGLRLSLFLSIVIIFSVVTNISICIYNTIPKRSSYFILFSCRLSDVILLILVAETTLALLRHPDYCISGYSSVSSISFPRVLGKCTQVNE